MKERGVLVKLVGLVAVGEWPRSCGALVRDGYLAGLVAQRAVKLLA